MTRGRSQKTKEVAFKFLLGEFLAHMFLSILRTIDAALTRDPLHVGNVWLRQYRECVVRLEAEYVRLWPEPLSGPIAEHDKWLGGLD